MGKSLRAQLAEATRGIAPENWRKTDTHIVLVRSGIKWWERLVHMRSILVAEDLPANGGTEGGRLSRLRCFTFSWLSAEVMVITFVVPRGGSIMACDRKEFMRVYMTAAKIGLCTATEPEVIGVMALLRDSRPAS